MRSMHSEKGNKNWSWIPTLPCDVQSAPFRYPVCSYLLPSLCVSFISDCLFCRFQASASDQRKSYQLLNPLSIITWSQIPVANASFWLELLVNTEALSWFFWYLLKLEKHHCKVIAKALEKLWACLRELGHV